MALIKRAVFLFIVMTSGIPVVLHAQVSGAALLADEIPLLERRLGNPGLSAGDRHGYLTRLGRLFLLSGNLEEAAGAFNRAAFANPDSRDDRVLLEAMRCYLALGETEKAESGIQMVLVSGKDQTQVREARFLAALSYAFRTGNTQALASLLGTAGEELTTAIPPASQSSSSDYTERNGRAASTILYALWKITGNETYRIRLRTEYPAGPEAKSLDEDPGRQIAGASAAMWVLFPGRDAVSLGSPVAAAAPQPAAAPARSADTASAAGAVLQTGLFSREENAQAMADRLKKAGFTPAVSRRTVNGAAYFAVSVTAADNVNAVIQRLKASGFEAFPVY
jgi:tetratricopeptide (TPR) repeat protein